MKRSRQTWLLPVLSILFFSSGVSALIYQVLWLRLLGLVFGVTIYAASTVWASFMAGLALGSIGAGRFADRVRRPLMWFGVCELLIGATALATPGALGWLQQVYARVYPSLPASLPMMTLARFAIALAVLIVPTALMGATLPLVLKSSTFRTARLGQRIALLYGMNTAGAIVGGLAAGLYLIPGRGIRETFFVAAVLNLCVGLSAILAGRSVVATGDASDDPVEHDAQRIAVPAMNSRRVHLVLAVFAVSGFTSLAFEVVWFRVLSLFLRPTVYGYALMMAAILGGIAIGSYLVTPLLDRRWKWIAILAGLEIGIGVAAVLSFGLLTKMDAMTAAATPLLSRVMAEWLVYPTMGSLLAIFPTALFMGLAFPIGLRLWAAGGGVRNRTLAERIGIFYSLNLAGAVLGSIAAGFFLLPWIGSQSSLIALGAMSFLSGLILFAASELGGSGRVIAGALGTVLFAAAVAGSPDPFVQFVEQRYRGQRIVWREEGIEATAVVLAAGDELSLTVNGNHQASTSGGQVYVHRSIGHLPMVLHPDARDALVIGLGGGATAGAVSIHDGVEVDVVELSGSVVLGSRYFSGVNYDLFSRPNVHVRVDDGRNFMLLTSRKYDVVTADVIHPIYAGSGNLYSAEYFQLVRRVLKPGGIVVQWVAGTDAEYKTIARTFLSVFPDVTVWRDGTLLVGSVAPLRLRRSDFQRKLQTPGRAQGAADLGLPTFDELLTAYRAGSDDLRAFVGEGPILTDDRPLVEYFLSLPRDRDVDLSLLKGDVRRIVADEKN